ncbi:TPA: arsenate reductase (glutaredoxin) [Stenotrophomonas maltophilia]|uniref:arsenate reductase (glutaredoxin) n=1 Tax=Stenotrophomonas maltophilia TaxID=40324 RepID=UPI002812823D|nr:arsenate reductase (glutaredoxin) [Stenotrophomonas maltophilia]WMR55923.1 arsenate reductase (glutaredoxin) [Stenotrophomonas maltophilia]HEL4774017.1 arsenate reductase (glutaredoxin) [Stenotrophomonas maltophilia]HEL5313262.1 arsenate reductase (glutaredoxin) [Stenotrophomonas maltophilia]HEL5595616.1 arsenate reductase (glutaredoxin) [Stenotrophomonas maltophilia]
MNAVIYHNPKCGTSRNTLALIRHLGIDPEVIDYLSLPPTRERLLELITAAGLTVREAIRQKGTPYEELGLGDLALDDTALLDAMLEHPILINRPFVQTDLGTRLCRPSEVVLQILPAMKKPFVKEDGEVINGPLSQRQ